MRRLLIAMFVVGGCSSGPRMSPDGIELMPGFDPEPAPANGLQILLPPVEGIKSGESYEYCTWTDHILDHDVDVKASKSFQTATGHHAVLFYTTKYEQPGTSRVCTDSDMATFRFGGVSGENEYTEAPANLVWRLPKGAQLIVQHHYLNATPKELRAQSAINLRFATPGEKSVLSGSLAFVDTALRVPPGEQTLSFDCELNRDFKAWQFFPHMHRWGTHVSIDHTVAGVTTRLFDLPWEESFTFHAPEIKRDPSNPFVLAKGDRIKVTCSWMNDTGKDLTFGNEMCVAFAQTVNDEELANLACDGGHWGDF
jgi:hypothetical protein